MEIEVKEFGIRIILRIAKECEDCGEEISDEESHKCEAKKNATE